MRNGRVRRIADHIAQIWIAVELDDVSRPGVHDFSSGASEQAQIHVNVLWIAFVERRGDRISCRVYRPGVAPFIRTRFRTEVHVELKYRFELLETVPSRCAVDRLIRAELEWFRSECGSGS